MHFQIFHILYILHKTWNSLFGWDICMSLKPLDRKVLEEIGYRIIRCFTWKESIFWGSILKFTTFPETRSFFYILSWTFHITNFKYRAEKYGNTKKKVCV